MPELPEVETIARSLRPHLVGRAAAAVEVRNRNLRRPLPRCFSDSLVVRLRRRGKYLLIEFETAPAWIVHLGMSGRLVYHCCAPRQPARHDHVEVRFEGGGSLVYSDPRRFGLMTLGDPDDCGLLAGLGPEPFDRDVFAGDYLFELGRRSRRAVKDVLMDQRVVAGIGNIYSNEILFAAGVRPRRRLSRLSRRDCAGVVEATRRILHEAIEHGGSSVSDFLDGIGRRGGYQWRRRVYDRAGEACLYCSATIKRVLVGGRSAFYCPSCQR